MTSVTALAPRPTTLEQAAIRLLVVDEHPIAQWGLQRIAGHEPDLDHVGGVDSLDQALPLLDIERPDVLIVSVEAPAPELFDQLAGLRSRRPGLGIVVLAAEPDDETLLRALDIGASAFVVKQAPVSEILAAVRHAAAAPNSFSATGLVDALRRRNQPSGPNLTPQEREVLHLLHQGLSTPAVAARLYISPSTAKTRISRVYHALGAANRAQALMTAVRLGLVVP